MTIVNQSPTDPAFVQNPYPFYASTRARGDLIHWQDYGMMAAFSHTAVHTLLRDKRLGRAIPAEKERAHASHLDPFYELEAHSMLELEAPRHTRLRSLVLRAFTSRKIKTLSTEIAQLSHELMAAMPRDDCDILRSFCTPLPVIIIARLLGVPEEMAPDLLRWSNQMVAMYQANRTRQTEDAAAAAATDFSHFMRGYIDTRRSRPADDLITHLIAAEEEGEKLSADELITTCILLLNAGHEATVHSLGNGLKTLLEHKTSSASLTPERIGATVEEILRYDPPLHMFTRYVYEDAEILGHAFKRSDEVALMLGAAGRDPAVWDRPDNFIPDRTLKAHLAFGGGVHFCVGAPLARLELCTALPIVFERLPNLRLAETPSYGDTYHFHGLSRLMVAR
ncbi:MAG: cytochrome P450 [Paracoccaceae bacterium]